MPIYGERDYLLPEYSGEVIKIDGVCYIFDGYESSSGVPDILEADGSYTTCEDCSASAISSDVLSSAAALADVSSSQSSISRSIYECLDWVRLDNCFVATEPYTYEGDWTGGEGGYWYQLKDAVSLLHEAPQTITFTWTLQKYTTASRFHDPIFELGEDPVVDRSPPYSGLGDPITKAEFLDEIQVAFNAWKDAFEFAYSSAFGFANQLTVNFIYNGDENSPSPPPIRGDFRFGMEDITDGALAHAYYPLRYADIGDGRNSPVLHFSDRYPWSKDSSIKHWGDARSYSIAYVAAHEIGHSLGFEHNEYFKGTLVNAYNAYSSVLFPGGVDRRFDAGRLDKAWGGKGLTNSYEDIRGIHEVYGMPELPLYGCTWACRDDLEYGASSGVADFTDGDILKINGECFEFVDTHTGPVDSLPSCSSGSNRVLSNATLEDVFSGCFDCASGLPDDVLDPLLSAKEEGEQALQDQQALEDSSASSSLDLSGRVTLINDDKATPEMASAIHCVDSDVWCIPAYYIDHILEGDTFELHFNESSSACFTKLQEGESSGSCDVVFDHLNPPINVVGPYFDCEDCVGIQSSAEESLYESSSSLISSSSFVSSYSFVSSSSAEDFGILTEDGQGLLTEGGEELILE